MKFRIPRKLTFGGCVVLFAVMLVVSLSTTALLALGVHFVLPQFDYWKEFVAVFIIGILIAQITRSA